MLAVFFFLFQIFQLLIYPFFPLNAYTCSRSTLFIYSFYNPRVARTAYIRVQVVHPLFSLADKALDRYTFIGKILKLHILGKLSDNAESFILKFRDVKLKMASLCHLNESFSM